MAQAAKKPHDIEADWDARALQSAIDACKDVISGHGINGRAMISSLSQIEWGWITAAAVMAWIKTKSQQATVEGGGYEIPIRTMNTEPPPWDAGAIETILPKLGDLQGVDWAKPIGEWSKDAIVSFAWQIHRMADGALAARDEGTGDKIVRRLDEAERKVSAFHGGSLMTNQELNDDVPF